MELDELEIWQQQQREKALRAWRRTQVKRNRHKVKKLTDFLPLYYWRTMGNWERIRRRRSFGHMRETFDQRYATRSERHRAKAALRRGDQPTFDREQPLD